MENANQELTQNESTANDRQQKIFNILKIFTECFVKNFERKSKYYYNLTLGQEKKLGGNIKAPELTNTIGTIGKAFQFLRGNTWSRSSKRKALNLIRQPFFKNPNKIRKNLVQAAVSIFACYEYQFINRNINRKADLEEISIEASERCLNYYKRRNNIMDSTTVAITKGVIRGKSRKKISKLPFKTHRVQNTYAGNLFNKVGLVTLAQNGQPDNYYKKKRGSVKHGYRLLLDWEQENIYRAYLLNVEYRRGKPPRIINYKYFLNPELMKTFSEEILNDLNNNKNLLRVT